MNRVCVCPATPKQQKILISATRTLAPATHSTRSILPPPDWTEGLSLRLTSHMCIAARPVIHVCVHILGMNILLRKKRFNKIDVFLCNLYTSQISVT